MEIVQVAAVFLLVFILYSAVIVPPGMAYIVESLGRYSKTIGPGFHMVPKFINIIRYKVPTSIQSLEIAESRTTVQYKIFDPRAASYNVSNYNDAVREIVKHTTKKFFNDVQAPDVTRAVSEEIREKLFGLGITLESIEVRRF